MTGQESNNSVSPMETAFKWFFQTYMFKQQVDGGKLDPNAAREWLSRMNLAMAKCADPTKRKAPDTFKHWEEVVNEALKKEHERVSPKEFRKPITKIWSSDVGRYRTAPNNFDDLNSGYAVLSSFIHQGTRESGPIPLKPMIRFRRL